MVSVSAAEWEALGRDLGRQEALLWGLLVRPVAAGAGQQGGQQQQPVGSSMTPAFAVRGGLIGPSGLRSGPASVPMSPRPPSVQELVRQRLQQVALKAKGRKRAKPS